VIKTSEARQTLITGAFRKRALVENEVTIKLNSLFIERWDLTYMADASIRLAASNVNVYKIVVKY
jgi:hypothetical protein